MVCSTDWIPARQRRSGSYPRQRFLSRRQAVVMRVRQRPGRQHRDGLAAAPAPPATHPDPGVNLVVCLFTAPAVTHDAGLATVWAVARQPFLRLEIRRFGVARRPSSWDKYDHRAQRPAPSHPPRLLLGPGPLHLISEATERKRHRLRQAGTSRLAGFRSQIFQKYFSRVFSALPALPHFSPPNPCYRVAEISRRASPAPAATRFSAGPGSVASSVKLNFP